MVCIRILSWTPSKDLKTRVVLAFGTAGHLTWGFCMAWLAVGRCGTCLPKRTCNFKRQFRLSLPGCKAGGSLCCTFFGSRKYLKWLLTRTTGQTFCQSSIWTKRALNYFQHGCLTRKPINDAKQPYKENHVNYIKLCVQNSWSCIFSKYCLSSYGNIYSDPLRANGVSYMFCTLVFLDNNNHWFGLVQFCLHIHAYSNQK